MHESMHVCSIYVYTIPCIYALIGGYMQNYINVWMYVHTYINTHAYRM